VREPIEAYYIKMLEQIATRATCPRRQVAAIITDNRNRILGTGYNGPPRGLPHCIDTPCPGAHDEPGNTSSCFAVHAEANAIINCSELFRAEIVYCTNLPCFECAKLIANTNIKKVFYRHDYADKRAFNFMRIALIHYVV
jgi:dCMP deaminase